ncbi:cysteine desulfurase [Xylographa opegraphella]|nr:cysteine desulfurase [Xylographa opegraphella]
MSVLIPLTLRQTSRLCSLRLSSSPGLLRSLEFPRPTGGYPGRRVSPRRSYVSETKAQTAQVNIETAINSGHKEFAAQTGSLPRNVQIPGTEMSADIMLSPAAGILKQATIMDEGTRPIYLDMQATTPTDPRVLDAMLPYFTGLYGNPHSRTHAYGWETEKATEIAREHVANLIGADPKEIIFTSGATESNNMSIKGVARFFGRSGKKRHIITSQTEHKCVLDSCRHMQEEGFEVTYLPVQSNGLIDMKALEAAIRPDTALVSIMTVNNEIGVIQPMEEIGKLCRFRKVFFHTDGAQAVGKMPINVNDWNVDLMSISAHKIYGPKVAVAKSVDLEVELWHQPWLPALARHVGSLGKKWPAEVLVFWEVELVNHDLFVDDADTVRQYDTRRITALSNRLIKGLLSLEHTTQNGDPERFYPGCVNVSFAYVEGESLLMALKDIALSSGSACTSASLEPSYVLRALGNSDESAHSSIRFGIGRFTTESEIDYVLKAVTERVSFLRELSPLWELVQEGIALDSIEWSQH